MCEWIVLTMEKRTNSSTTVDPHQNCIDIRDGAKTREKKRTSGKVNFYDLFHFKLMLTHLHILAHSRWHLTMIYDRIPKLSNVWNHSNLFELLCILQFRILHFSWHFHNVNEWRMEKFSLMGWRLELEIVKCRLWKMLLTVNVKHNLVRL